MPALQLPSRFEFNVAAQHCPSLASCGGGPIKIAVPKSIPATVLFLLLDAAGRFVFGRRGMQTIFGL